MTGKQIIQLSAEAGRIILENGGETNRVESTISHICHTYGIEVVDSFVTPTGIIMSAIDTEGESISTVKRIAKRTINLEKVRLMTEVEALIIQQRPSYHEVKEMLEEVRATPPYGADTTLLMSGLTAAGFTMLFGGQVIDTPVAFLVGMVINLLAVGLDRLQLTGFLINLFGGFIATLIPLQASTLYGELMPAKITIGSIMLLVPGLAITNAIRDIIAGDLVSGLSRGMEAFFVAVAISAGAGICYHLWMML